MIVLKIIFCVLICVNVAFGWFENCTNVYDLTTANSPLQVDSPNFPNYRYNEGSSCKYYVSAPVGYTIELACSINLDTPVGDCGSQRFYISKDGDRNLGWSEYQCGYGSLTRNSVGNEIAFGYTSNSGGSGYFSCKVKLIATTATNCDCGWSKNAKIVGGTEAVPNEFISMVGLVDISKTKPEFPIFCGGAIISEFFVLTAAHCFNMYLNGDYSKLYILAGDHDISTVDDTPYPVIYKITSVIKHGSYVPTSEKQDYDIALAKTNEQIRFKKTIGPACLPYVFMNENAYFNGLNVIVPGWGAEEFAGPSPNKLKKTPLKVENTCATSNQICTSTTGADACTRDSGGSLYWTASGRQYTVGIVSFGLACASKVPATNTRVTSYISWIESKATGAFFCRK